jgi:hypothetical protein
MVAPLTRFCLVFFFHNPFIIIADNPPNIQRITVDCGNSQPLTIKGGAA